MLTWFTKHAPIRRKFTVMTAGLAAIGLANLIAAALVAGGALAPWTGALVAGLGLAATLGGMLLAKELVCRSYVETVVRMEAMAAGDLTAPVRRIDHTDCVGRMTRAMDTFRANALRVKEAEADQSGRVVETLSAALNRLAEGDLTHRISGMPPGEHERLAEAFNTSVARLEGMIGAVRATASGPCATNSRPPALRRPPPRSAPPSASRASRPRTLPVPATPSPRPTPARPKAARWSARRSRRWVRSSSRPRRSPRSST